MRIAPTSCRATPLASAVSFNASRRSRRLTTRISALMAVAAMAAVPVTGGAQLVGAGAGGNEFPFVRTASTGTVYQQLYNGSLLTGGILESVSFFRFAEGTLRNTTINLYASTTSRAVNGGLSASDFDSNRGSDNTLLGTYTFLGTSAPSTLQFFASNPFTFDPSSGNLLLDFRFSGNGSNQTLASFRADNGTANGAFSRSGNFAGDFSSGASNTNWGLQTEFTWGEPTPPTEPPNQDPPTTAVPEPETYLLMCSGLMAMGLVARKRRGSLTLVG